MFFCENSNLYSVLSWCIIRCTFLSGQDIFAFWLCACKFKIFNFLGGQILNQLYIPKKKEEQENTLHKKLYFRSRVRHAFPPSIPNTFINNILILRVTFAQRRVLSVNRFIYFGNKCFWHRDAKTTIFDVEKKCRHCKMFLKDKAWRLKIMYWIIWLTVS